MGRDVSWVRIPHPPPFKTAALRSAAAGLALGGVTLAIGYLVGKQANLQAMTSELTDTLDDSTGALTKYSRAMVVRKLAEDDTFKAAKEAGVSQKQLTDSILEGGDALDKTLEKFGKTNSLGHTFDGVAFRSVSAQGKIKDLAKAVEDSQTAFDNQEKANGDSGETAATVAEQYQAEAATVSDLSSELQQLVEQFNEANGVNQDAISANASYQEALAGLADQVADQRKNTEGYTTSLNENTAIGASNASMLSDLADKAQTSAKAQFDVDQSTMGAKAASDKYASTLAAQRQKFIESATAAGFNAGEVKKLADRVFQLPSEKQIKILANTDQAQTALADFIRQYDGRVIRMNTINSVQQVVSGSGVTTQRAVQANGSVLDFYANGGFGESHVAQIAAAGTMRVWAEPETGGEAYIPLATSKRTRSLAIWEETGRRLQAFADGDVRGGTPTYVPTPPQVIYAQSSAPEGAGGTWVFEPHYESSGNQRQDFDDAWLQFKQKIRGSR